MGDCDMAPIVCAIIINETCHDDPTRGRFRKPVPMCISYELHPRRPFLGGAPASAAG